MSTRCIYFAYGSNLHPLRLRERVPSAQVLARSVLRQHELVYGKRGLDGSGKCTVRPARGGGTEVHGVLFEMLCSERRVLDRAEGPLYERKLAYFRIGKQRLRGFYYEAKDHAVDVGLTPFDWYRDLVVAGARYHGLPEAYVALLAGVSCQPDFDARRALNMRALLARMSIS